MDVAKVPEEVSVSTVPCSWSVHQLGGVKDEKRATTFLWSLGNSKAPQTQPGND